jgi:peptide/nickel transport system substrate-binding protein
VSPRRALPILAALLCGTSVLTAQRSAPRGTLVIAVAQEAATPVPTLWRNDQGNREVSDLLFLHLADPDPAYQLTREGAWQPRLARRWTRRDARTLAFEIDPRARWHDGTPVTARDVALGLERGRDPVLAPQTATLLRRIASVTVESERVAVVRFREAYGEQFYDAVFHAPPLPAHLLAGLPPDSLATSAFTRSPVGNGPYRFERRVPGQLLELRANDGFFLGRPGILRVLLLVAGDGEARVNLLLAGEADAVDNIYGLPNWSRVERLPDLAYYPLPGLQLNYANLNFRDPADTSRPHPLFADAAVRRALALSVDRERMARTAYGPMTSAPGAPLSALTGRGVDLPAPLPYDTGAARRLLASRGWADHDGDGVLDKDGLALRFRVMVPSVSASRIRMATEMQESWRRLGIAAELEQVERAVFVERHSAGRFDIDMYGVSQDPTPSGLTQSWSCAGIGGSNAIRYCNPVVDSLLSRAQLEGKNAPRLYRDAARVIAADAPAIFLAAPVSGVAVHRRFTRVRIRPESAWADLWRWALRPELALERDRQ